ncbi:MAG: 16S rRNA (cytidine(1402)-2'-O)-methyltransferase [Actinomycetota bacterium]|nr:16S rRNA (cytidine(1402)-2'-O)-methyltransferase [Actinomycetota bacterium]
MSGAGRLVVVATPIGNLGDLSPRARATLGEADVVACEDTRHTGVLLQASGVRAHRLVSLHEHNEAARVDELLAVLTGGGTVALVSDAGTPLVSDPGARLVAAAAAADVVVQAVPGPSALLAALVVSGFDTRRFRFEGFLARKGTERRAALERLARAEEPTVCYESPQRLTATLSELAARCGGDRRVAVARELTKRFEETWRGTLAEAERWSGDHAARGEYVLVLDAAPPALAGAERSPEDLRDLAGRLIAAGLRRKDAASALEICLSLPRRTAYDASLAGTAAREEAASEGGGDAPVR